MRPQDIQIGDWCHLHYATRFEGKVSFNFKVSQLRMDYGEEILVWGEKTPDGKHFGNMGEVSKIEPVPLTEDILRKNFPTTDILAWYPCHYPSKTDYFRILYDNDWKIEKDVCYVHELQHILRLAGENAEIEL